MYLQANKPEDAAAGRKKSTPSKAGTKRKNSEACEEVPAVPDQDLPPCLHPMPVVALPRNPYLQKASVPLMYKQLVISALTWRSMFALPANVAIQLRTSAASTALAGCQPL